MRRSPRCAANTASASRRTMLGRTVLRHGGIAAAAPEGRRRRAGPAQADVCRPTPHTEGRPVAKRLGQARRQALSLALPDTVWSIDFMSNAHACGRRFRTFNVVDDSQVLRSDNGPELLGKASTVGQGQRRGHSAH